MSLSLMEFMERPGVTELAWGHPDPRFLPVTALRAAADRALRRYGPNALGYGRPAGGYFIWVTLPPGHDTRELQPVALERGIGFAPGRTFFGDAPGGARSLRLAFSRYDPERLEGAVRQLGHTLSPSRRSSGQKQDAADEPEQ